MKKMEGQIGTDPLSFSGTIRFVYLTWRLYWKCTLYFMEHSRNQNV